MPQARCLCLLEFFAMSSLHQTLPKHLPPVVALLGGSFNPAHEGHVHISREAMRLLGISQVWWMVSPQNPLKPVKDMADFNDRMAHALKLAQCDPRITVTDIEAKLGSRHTARTLRLLQKHYPNTRFIWLMGADNLADIHHWEKWTRIFNKCPILVLDRAPLSHRALHAKAAIYFKKQRVDMRQTRQLKHANTPIWCFAHIKRHPASATDLRKTLGKKAFLS